MGGLGVASMLADALGGVTDPAEIAAMGAEALSERLAVVGLSGLAAPIMQHAAMALS